MKAQRFRRIAGIFVFAVLSSVASMAFGFREPVEDEILPDHFAFDDVAVGFTPSTLQRDLIDPQWRVTWSPLGTVRTIWNPAGFLTETSRQRPEGVALRFLRERWRLFGLTEGGISLRLDAQYNALPKGVWHLYYTLEDPVSKRRLPFSRVSVHIDGATHRIIAVAASRLPAEEPVGLPEAELSQEEAIGFVLDHAGVRSEEELMAPLTIEPVLFATPEGVVAAYRASVPVSGVAWYDITIDGRDGSLLQRFNRYWFFSPAKGRVFLEHPNLDGFDDIRQLVSFAGDRDASPQGWVFSDATEGNNATAWEDRDGNNRPGDRAVARDGIFDFPLDLSRDPKFFIDHSITNLFYFVNVAHDFFYNLGFTEAAGNFQEDNFGRGGRGRDPVIADAQDGSGVNNANFMPQPEGTSGRLQMFLFNITDPRRDASNDSEIVFHEYGHGVSTRLVGGPNDVQCIAGNQGMALGEGLSDALAFGITGDPVMGEYLTGNPDTGVRRVAYDDSPLTYGDYAGIEPHKNGEIWASAMWDLRAYFVDRLGESAGNERMMRLLLEALPMVPCAPSFLDARDAVLQALGGKSDPDYCGVWDVFARRGMGVDAVAGRRPADGFSVPSECSGGGGDPGPGCAVSGRTNAPGFTLLFGWIAILLLFRFRK